MLVFDVSHQTLMGDSSYNYLRLGHNSRFVFLAMSIDELG
jgi:hypothetical protein